MKYYISELYHAKSFFRFLLNMIGTNITTKDIEQAEFKTHYMHSRGEYNLLKYSQLDSKLFEELPDGTYFLSYDKLGTYDFNDYLYCRIKKGYIDEIWLDEFQFSHFRDMFNHECDKNLMVFEELYDSLLRIVESRYDYRTIDRIMNLYIDEEFEKIKDIDSFLFEDMQRIEEKTIYRVLNDFSLDEEMQCDENEWEE